ncbi:hypothetical protein [Demequina phytophila]|uniref:hypothetical protein n=1 Tax=Demequina phytophila TaxID=1638981 RepID=UPI0007805265|nr:hypothetical protein [Demequina phytophila]
MTRRRAWALATGLAGWILALVFVKVSLAWSDSLPYDPAAAEPRYIVLILITVAIVASGTVAAALLWRRPRPRRDPHDPGHAS